MTDYLARPHQVKVLKSQKKIVFLGGGVGCGKTEVGTLWHLNRVANTPKDTPGLIAANSYSQLIDATIRNVYKNYRKLGVLVKPEQLPRSHHPFDIQVFNGEYWVDIWCRSLDSFQLLSGTEVGWFWADEVWQTKREAIDLLLARHRGVMEDRLQSLFTTTLDDPTTWMYELFVEKFNEQLMDVFYATTYDNEKNLPPGYIEGLKALYSEQMFKRMVMSQWVSLDGQNIYYNFDRKVNVSEDAEFDPHLPIYWTHDFNIGEGKPMSSALAHIKKGPGPDGKIRPELHFFDEIVLDTADTNDAAEEFQERSWIKDSKAGVIVCGDASGRAKDTRSKTTDYKILATAGFKHQEVSRSNPPIRERHNTVNTLFKAKNGDVRLKIHPRCRTIIKGADIVKLKKGANYLEDDTIREQHIMTAVGYLAVKKLSLRMNRATAFKPMG